MLKQWLRNGDCQKTPSRVHNLARRDTVRQCDMGPQRTHKRSSSSKRPDRSRRSTMEATRVKTRNLGITALLGLVLVR
jgi:hypothetical protein